jgi:hypothetical protein
VTTFELHGGKIAQAEETANDGRLKTAELVILSKLNIPLSN